MMNKKILFVATQDSFHRAFHLDLFKKLHENGWTIDVASKGNEEFINIRNKFDLSITRTPFSTKNFKGIKQLRKIINDNNYDIIHSHTPLGGVVARVGNKSQTTKNVYTAHGFHFYKGAPLLNWLLYYPVEKYLSKRTDLIITINKEDFDRAKRKFVKPKVRYINGVGINFDKFNVKKDTSYIRTQLGLTEDDFIITSVGELNNNKNQMFIIKQLKKIVFTHDNIKYLIVGKGPNRIKYERFIKKNKLAKNIFILGHRNDIPELLKESNLHVSASKREGLPLNVIEAMRSKTLTLVSNNRGHRSIIKDNVNGFIFDLNNKKEFNRKVYFCYNQFQQHIDIVNFAFNDTELYNVNHINQEIIKLYNQLLS